MNICIIIIKSYHYVDGTSITQGSPIESTCGDVHANGLTEVTTVRAVLVPS